MFFCEIPIELHCLCDIPHPLFAEVAVAEAEVEEVVFELEVEEVQIFFPVGSDFLYVVDVFVFDDLLEVAVTVKI